MKKSKFIIPQGTDHPRTRKHLNADALFSQIRHQFGKINDPRSGNVEISLTDALMSGFAMFSLKDPSLLAFDQRRKQGDPNLSRIYGIERAPCDTQMREILDEVDPGQLRASFKRAFSQLQRGKALEQLTFLNGCYLLSGDGTGYYYSMKVTNEACLEKKSGSNSETAYYQQFYGASLVHPDYREVIPFCPEPIVKQDGQSKNDCERSASKRFMAGLRKDHPHLPVIMVEDALHSNAPHIRDLQAHRLHFILGAKESDHHYLFHEAFLAEQAGRSTNITIVDPQNPKKKHNFFFVNGLPLNKSNQDVMVNLLEYWEISLDDEGNEIRKKQKHFSWVTDLEITAENVYDIMRAGRARWKIENETFNTLKNQGYHLEHNYGLGKKYLSLVFMTLTMLAFMVDQIQQLCCGLFRAAWQKAGNKRALWEGMRAVFQWFELESMEMLLQILRKGGKAAFLENTS
jgi:hypothetical protein